MVSVSKLICCVECGTKMKCCSDVNINAMCMPIRINAHSRFVILAAKFSANFDKLHLCFDKMRTSHEEHCQHILLLIF